MSDLEEIKALLQEIRDLQKAHFERYKEFTQAVLDREKTRSQELEQSQLEQRRYREEMRSRYKAGWIFRLVLLGIAVGAVILVIGATLLANFLLRVPGP